MGRLSPDYYCMDGTIPRKHLAHVLNAIDNMSKDYGLPVCNVFHVGDGNLHPLILYDANNADEMERAEKCGAEVLELCVKAGGCLTGEHGVGVEKRELMLSQFTPTDLEYQMRIKTIFDPDWLLNPAKVFPLEVRVS